MAGIETRNFTGNGIIINYAEHVLFLQRPNLPVGPQTKKKTVYPKVAVVCWVDRICIGK